MEWQAIKTAPKDGTKVLGWSASDGFVVCDWGESSVFDRRGHWCYTEANAIGGEFNARLTCDPTHWSPLPPPPQETR